MYDIAISTACPSLDYIIVDTVKDAEACVNYLRENHIGRATFLGLEKMA
jgi:structural maintenance of chromosome 4